MVARTAVAVVALLAAGLDGGAASAQSGRLVIGSVNNAEFVALKELLPEFNRMHPNIEVEFQLVPENEVRAKITTDVTTQSGVYDLVTVGPYEVPMWAKAGWLESLDALKEDPEYQFEDIFEKYIEALSYDGRLYAAPGSAQASMLYYRKDLLDAAGITIPEQPTWDEVIAAAEKLHKPAEGIYGICLRGLPGWGQMGAPLGTVINTFGGRWYDAEWNAQITSPETSAAIKFYIDALQRVTPPGITQFGNLECGQAMTTGQVAMMYDDSSWTQVFFDPNTNPYAAHMAVAMAPVKERGTKPSAWFWTWTWAIPTSANNKEAALAFVKWVTGPDYIPFAAPKVGWGRMPGPARKSQYQPGSEYYEFAKPFIDVLRKTLETVDGVNATHYEDTPYRGNQYVQIPEFQELGNKCTQEFAGAVVGQQTADEAIAKCQQYAEEVAIRGGYKKG